MKILLIGPQGSGKSTQADLLARQLNVPKITVGDIFRDLAKQDSEQGKKIKAILEAGKLVDDDLTARIVKEKLSREEFKEGFVVDGYPRTLEQANIFDPNYDKVFYLNLQQEKATERLLKRGRADDTSELIKKRLDLYQEQTQPLLDYYKDLGKLIEIEGEGSIEQVCNRIINFLKNSNG